MQRLVGNALLLGFIDPLPNNVLDRLEQSQTHRQLVKVGSTHIIGDEKGALDVISVNGGVTEILTPAVRTL